MKPVCSSILPARGKFLAFGVSPFFDQLAWLWEGGLLTLHIRHEGYAQARINELHVPIPTEELIDAQVFPYLITPGDPTPEIESLALIRWRGGKSLLCSGAVLRMDYHTVDMFPKLAALSTRTSAVSVCASGGYISWDIKNPRASSAACGSHPTLEKFLTGKDLCRVSYVRHDGTVVIAATVGRAVEILVWDTRKQTTVHHDGNSFSSPPTILVLHPMGKSAVVADSEMEWFWKTQGSDYGRAFSVRSSRIYEGKFYQPQRLGFYRQGDYPGGYDLFEKLWEVREDGSLWTSFSGQLDVVRE